MAVYNKKDFLAHVDQLAPVGFKRLGNEPYYVKKVEDKEYRIYYSFNEYYPHSVVIRGIRVDISFDLVENILNEILRTNPLAAYSPNEKGDTIGRGVYNIFGVDYSLLDTHDVEDNSSFNVIKPHLQLLIGAALQFFDDFSILQNVFDYAESLPISEMPNFIEQPMPFRRMIIKKLVGDSGYQAYVQQLMDFYTNENDTNRIKFTIALKNRLDELE